MSFAALAAYVVVLVGVSFSQPRRWLAHAAGLGGAAAATALLIVQVRSDRQGDPIGMYGAAAVLFLCVGLAVYALLTTALAWRWGVNARRVALIHALVVLVAPVVLRVIDLITR